MCGIGGAMVFSAGARPLDEACLAALGEEMRHRGPDGAGMWLSRDRRVGLVHRRLSIIDLSAKAAQPMRDSSGDICVTYNGEIYNHAELRRELERKGHSFRTDHADTEVLVEAYREWGVECLHRLRGMFAFALWDGRAQRLWLVRDRVGVKPLYYAIRPDRIIFASEIKALLTDRELPRAIDEEAFFHYLSFLTVPAPQTLFAGVSKLAGGTYLLIDRDGQVTERRYWDALEAAEPVDGSDDEIAERLRAELRDAVRLRKISDVPVGVFLSGGIDSGTIAALFSEGGERPVNTFTVGYDRDYESYQNELNEAGATARLFGAEHREIRVSARDFAEFLPRMIELQDEPIADPVCVPVHFVADLARRHGVVVNLVGEGADELFWGYPNWRRAWHLQRLNDRVPAPRMAKTAALAALRACGKQHSQPYRWLDRAARGLPIFWGGAEAYGEPLKHELLSPRLRAAFRGRSSWEAIAPIHARYCRHAADPSPLAWMSYLDLNLRLPELLLMRVDKMTMGSGVEARVPFLDHRLVEFALGIPEPVKTRGHVLKSVLKRAVRGVIPDEIIDRPKRGFGVPAQEWLGGALGEELRDRLDNFVDRTDLLDRKAVTAFFADPSTAASRWCLLNAALWWERFIRPAPSPVAAAQPARVS